MVITDTSPLQLNVLISNDGRPLLVDFGFSFIVNSSDIEGGRGGTPHWMAPEQFDSDECTALATAQADVWAFGMTALVCLLCPTFYLSFNVLYKKRNSLHDTALSPKSTHSHT